MKTSSVKSLGVPLLSTKTTPFTGCVIVIVPAVGIISSLLNISIVIGSKFSIIYSSISKVISLINLVKSSLILLI